MPDLEEVGQHALVEPWDPLSADDGGNGVGCPSVGEAVSHGTLHLHAPADHIQGVADCTRGRRGEEGEGGRRRGGGEGGEEEGGGGGEEGEGGGEEGGRRGGGGANRSRTQPM